MKKDIEIPKVEGIYVVAVKQWNDDFNMHDWNVFLVNKNSFPITDAIIVSKGYKGSTLTSTMRHKLAVLPAKSYAKVELLQPELLSLTNEFSVSYFIENKMFHKNFKFLPNSIKETNLGEIPIMTAQGIEAT